MATENQALAALASRARNRYGLYWPLRAEVLKFIRSYQETAAEPRPFTGRTEIMRELDQWLLQNESRLLLLSGPAGRGKSALLLNWLGRLIQGDSGITIFCLPISIRFNTADETAGVQLLFSALCDVFELKQQLPQQPEIQDYLQGIARAWQEVAQRSDQRFLLAVDGLDEAVNQWFLERHILPQELPPNLHVLISARHKPGHASGSAWLTGLGQTASVAQVLEVGCLERQVMAEAVRQLGHPLEALAERQAFTEHLYRLTSDGDPLLLTLWLAQIWRARGALPDMTPAVLAQLQPGFGQFYRLWMGEQQAIWEAARLNVHPDDFKQVMQVLALAQGRLQLGDLVELLTILSPGRWEHSQLRTVLETAHRLVVADETGYVLVHPRLAHHFQQELDADPPQRSAVDAAFRQWGADTVRRLNNGALNPQECSAYLLSHYVSAHLGEGGEGGADEELMALLQPGWAYAWYAREGTWHGYLNDLQRVTRRWQAENQRRLRAGEPLRVAPELRSALFAASVRSLISALPPELLGYIVRQGVWSLTRGVAVARQYGPDVRAQALLELAGIAALKEDQAAAASLLQEALETAAAIEYPVDCARALIIGSDSLQGEAQRTVLRRAFEAVGRIENPPELVRTLKPLASRCEADQALLLEVISLAARNEGVRTAMQLATQLQGEDDRHTAFGLTLDAVAAIPEAGPLATCLSELAPLLHKEGALLQRALEVATAIPDASARSAALTGLAAHLPAEARGTAIALALQAVAENPREWMNATGLICTLVEDDGGQLQQAIELAGAIEDRYERVKALSAAAAHLQESAQRTVLERACTAAGEIEDTRARAKALYAAAAQLQEPARGTIFEQASTVGAQLTASERVEVLGEVALDRPEEARDWVLEQALEQALSAPPGEYAQPLSWVTSLLQTADVRLQRVLEAAAAIPDADGRSAVLEAAASRLAGEARQRVLQEALSAGKHRDPNWRATNLTQLAWLLQGQARHAVLGQALEAAESTEDEFSLVMVLVNGLCEQLQEDRDYLQRALKIAARVSNDDWRRLVVVALAPGLKADTALWQQALDVVLAIRDGHLQSGAQLQVARQLQGEWRHTALRWALETRAATGDEAERALLAIVPEVLGDSALLQRALEGAAAADRNTHVNALCKVIDTLQGEARTGLLEQALEVAVGIEDEQKRAVALDNLSRHLGADGRLLKRAIEAAGAMRDADYRRTTLMTLAAQGAADTSVQQQALAAALAIDDKAERARTLSEVSAHMPADTALLQQALSAALLEDAGDRLRVLGDPLKQSQPQTFVQEAVAVAALIDDGRNRAYALCDLTTHLQGEARLPLAQQALTAAQSSTDPDLRCHILQRLGPLLKAYRVFSQQALEGVASMDGDFNRSRTLIALAPGLAPDSELLQYSLDIAAAIQDEEARSDALSALVPQLQVDGALLQQAFEAAAAIKDEGNRSRALRAVADQLPGDSALFQQAFTTIWAIQSGESRAHTHLAVAARLEGDAQRTAQSQAIEAAAAIEDGRERALTLIAVAEHLQGEARHAAFRQAISAAATVQGAGPRANTLYYLPKEVRQDPELSALCLEQVLGLPGTETARIDIAQSLAAYNGSLLTYDLWFNLLQAARLDRAQLLMVIGSLTDCAVALTGRTQEAQEIASAIHDVFEWFP